MMGMLRHKFRAGSYLSKQVNGIGIVLIFIFFILFFILLFRKKILIFLNFFFIKLGVFTCC